LRVTSPICLDPLSLHDALPIFRQVDDAATRRRAGSRAADDEGTARAGDAMGVSRRGHRTWLLASDGPLAGDSRVAAARAVASPEDRKSTRLTPVTWPSRMPSSA